MLGYYRLAGLRYQLFGGPAPVQEATYSVFQAPGGTRGYLGGHHGGSPGGYLEGTVGIPWGYPWWYPRGRTGVPQEGFTYGF